MYLQGFGQAGKDGEREKRAIIFDNVSKIFQNLKSLHTNILYKTPLSKLANITYF